VKDDTKLKLYGTDEFAMKTAVCISPSLLLKLIYLQSHEKNGLVSLYHCGINVCVQVIKFMITNLFKGFEDSLDGIH
jgi:hypothetical protein